MINKYIVDLTQVRLSDLELVGGKNASLGEKCSMAGCLGVFDWNPRNVSWAN